MLMAPGVLLERRAIAKESFRGNAVATLLGKVIFKWIMSKLPRSEETLLPRSLNRRNFLKAAGSAAILPAVFPAFAAQSAKTTANNTINLGVIGMGWQGP